MLQTGIGRLYLFLAAPKDAMCSVSSSISLFPLFSKGFVNSLNVRDGFKEFQATSVK